MVEYWVKLINNWKVKKLIGVFLKFFCILMFRKNENILFFQGHLFMSKLPFLNRYVKTYGTN